MTPPAPGRWLLRVLVPLLLGGCVYLVRPLLGSRGGAVAGVLPDALWCFAMLSAIDLCWPPHRSGARALWSVAAIVLAIAFEWRPISGGDGRIRLDVLDASAYAVVGCGFWLRAGPRGRRIACVAPEPARG
jgi:hypothetical protein